VGENNCGGRTRKGDCGRAITRVKYKKANFGNQYGGSKDGDSVRQENDKRNQKVGVVPPRQVFTAKKIKGYERARLLGQGTTKRISGGKKKTAQQPIGHWSKDKGGTPTKFQG